MSVHVGTRRRARAALDRTSFPAFPPSYFPVFLLSCHLAILPSRHPAFPPSYHLPSYLLTYEQSTFCPSGLPAFQPSDPPIFRLSYVLPSYLPSFLPLYLLSHLPTFLLAYYGSTLLPSDRASRTFQYSDYILPSNLPTDAVAHCAHHTLLMPFSHALFSCPSCPLFHALPGDRALARYDRRCPRQR